MKNAIWLILTEKQQKYQRYYPEKNDKYEYLTGFFILPSNQRQVIEQDKFTYSPLGKAFEKQIKAIEEQGKKQIKNNWRALEVLKSEEKKENIKSIEGTLLKGVRTKLNYMILKNGKKN